MEKRVAILLSDLTRANERYDMALLEYSEIFTQSAESYVDIAKALNFKFKKMKNATQLSEAISTFKHAVEINQDFLKKAIESANKLIALEEEIATEPKLPERVLELYETKEIKTAYEADIIEKQVQNLVRTFRKCNNEIIPNFRKGIDDAKKVQNYLLNTYDNLCDLKAEEDSQSI
ncbi:MAG: hypothetical protein WCX32_04545 [Clostridia bacterium]|nr:hypothetical protein [Clostridia bacterium]